MQNPISFSDLSQKFLAWNKTHRSEGTLIWYTGYIESFLEFLGDTAKSPAIDMKPYQVVEWMDSYGTAWGDNYKGGAIITIKRIYNWALELGYVDVNPVAKLKKPPSKRRDVYTTPDDYEWCLTQIKDTDPFKDILKFIWHTGCRPQEARHIEARHVELDRERIVFPAEESKGKRAKRIIYVQGEALDILKRLYAIRHDGKIFRNKDDGAWTKYAICNRMNSLSKKRGKRIIAYGSRHGFAQRKLIAGHDHLVVAELMGHTDGSMLAKVYSHLADNPQHLKDALKD